MSKVFISYSRKDLVFVKRLAENLQAAGIEPWYDVSGLKAGSRWGKEIQEVIQNSQFFMVILSPESITSEWVEKEFLFASNLKKMIIPILYRPCDLPMWCVNLQVIDFHHKNFQHQFNTLLSALNIKGEAAAAQPAIHPKKIKIPSQASRAPRHNLPTQLTSFIGREKEISEVTDLIQKHRLVTLTGAGGTGKTRLSLQVASSLLDTFPNGTWFVDLAPLTDPNLIPQTILADASIQLSQNKDVLLVLKDYLRDKKCLLIFDNCEHLVAACAHIVETILKEASEVKILATSREALSVPGELVWRVPSLSTPDAKKLPALSELSKFEAIRLFCERAELVIPTFKVKEDNAAAVAQICAQLDGIPLAIELAAARLRIFSPQLIASRLDDRFNLLTGGTRTSLPRHKTLRALIDWSYSLLSPQECILLDRLSVFAGGWSLEAAEAVCEDSEICRDIPDLLSHLLDKSLIQVEHQEGRATRFNMLETIKQYVAQRIYDPEKEELRSKHFTFFLSLAKDAEPHLLRNEQLEWLNRLEDDHANLISALTWALEGERTSSEKLIESGLLLCNAIFFFWYRRGYWNEAEYFLRKLLDAYSNDPVSIASARALSSLCMLGGNLSRADHFAEESIRQCRMLGDNAGLARALRIRAGNAVLMDDFSNVKQYLYESLSLYQELEDTWGIAYVNLVFGQVAWFCERDAVTAKDYCETCLLIFRQIGDQRNIANCLQFLSVIEAQMGNLEKASVSLTECLEIARNMGDKDGVCRALSGFGWLKLGTGEFDQADTLLKESLAIARELNNDQSIAEILVNLAQEARFQGDYELSHQIVSEALVISERNEDNLTTTWSLTSLGALSRIQKEYCSSQEYIKRALAIVRKLSDREVLIFWLEEFAALLIAQELPSQATEILGAAHVYRNVFYVHPLPMDKKEIDGKIEAIKGSLDDITFNSAWEKGQSFKPEEALDYAEKCLNEISKNS